MVLIKNRIYNGRNSVLNICKCGADWANLNGQNANITPEINAASLLFVRYFTRRYILKPVTAKDKIKIRLRLTMLLKNN